MRAFEIFGSLEPLKPRPLCAYADDSNVFFYNFISEGRTQVLQLVIYNSFKKVLTQNIVIFINNIYFIFNENTHMYLIQSTYKIYINVFKIMVRLQIT